MNEPLVKILTSLLGKSVDHQSLLGLARAVNENPRDPSHLLPFHDALQDAGLLPGMSLHSDAAMSLARTFPGREQDEIQDAAVHLMNHRLEPLRQQIESAWGGGNGADALPISVLHRQAAAIAAEHGNHELAASHNHAADYAHQPTQSSIHPGAMVWSRASHSGTGEPYDWGLHDAVFDRLPTSDLGKTDRYAYYDTPREAWDAFHHAHAAVTQRGEL